VSPALVGAFIREVAVEGFRGIGPVQTLELRPGPGLTLVVGRNGSGKSSFAEGLEVLLTGDSLRWKERAAVWREGWRNLHHPAASLSGTFLLEGERGPCVVSRRWEPEGRSKPEVLWPRSTTSRAATSNLSAGPRPCAPIAPSCPTTSWAHSSTKGRRSFTTP
jgi:hypothetical protein